MLAVVGHTCGEDLIFRFVIRVEHEITEDVAFIDCEQNIDVRHSEGDWLELCTPCKRSVQSFYLILDQSYGSRGYDLHF
ncbi:hypothetical protein PM082_016676 [Marasmius tenuissimus]|nr:hypothetical protein PM082_016676 [Marasmius tenuissimus]